MTSQSQTKHGRGWTLEKVAGNDQQAPVMMLRFFPANQPEEFREKMFGAINRLRLECKKRKIEITVQDEPDKSITVKMVGLKSVPGFEYDVSVEPLHEKESGMAFQQRQEKASSSWSKYNQENYASLWAMFTDMASDYGK